VNLNTAGWASRVLTPLLRIIRSSPNATVPVVVISEPVNSETAALVNADIALVAKGTGATLAQVPDETAAGGNKRGTNATDWQKSRSINTYVASGNYSTIAGGQNNTASNTLATVSGGDSNIASGIRSTIAGGNGNTASSQNSFVGGGQSNTAQTSTHATVCGGSSNTASGQYSFVGGGSSNTASGLRSTVVTGETNTASASNACIVGGQNHTANGTNSFVAGGRRGTTRSISGNHVFAACNIPITNATGVTQSGLLLLARETTNATATVLTSDPLAAGTTNQVILPNNSAYSFSGEVIAGVTGGGNTARWTIDGAIKRGANAASTTMVGTATVTMTHFDAGAATWSVAVTADTTNGGIAVTVTGAAATTIRWVCKINTTEMTY
jgi:hypothetical protein